MSRTSQKKLCVLIVDDNPDDVLFYKDLLINNPDNSSRYTVLEAEDGEQALDICKKHSIDACLLDYNLPTSDGVSILNEMRKVHTSKNFPVVMLTGMGTQEIQAEAARSGAMDYVTKDATTTPERLDEIITRVIDWSNGSGE